MLREGGPAVGPLRGSGFDLEDLRRRTEAAVARNGPTSIDIPLSGSAKEALEIAAEEGRRTPGAP